MAHQEENTVKSETFINVRKLAALDIVFHGPRLILAEFAFGMVLCAALGLWSFFSPIHSPFMFVIGCFLLWVALNYVPLLLYAISIVRRKSAQQEVAFELAHKVFEIGALPLFDTAAIVGVAPLWALLLCFIWRFRLLERMLGLESERATTSRTEHSFGK